ncbi:MAG: 23S rRNA (adenine(2503)-C(2))-methyltransferase RlmN [Bacteroidota bacterium]
MSGNRLPDIRELSRTEIEQFFLLNGGKKFRARQVYDWLWKKPCRSFNDMTNLSKDTRKLLLDNFSFNRAEPEIRQKSSDGTVKTRFRLHDGLLVEGVLIPSGERSTVCISSQVGCALGCKFCATGQLGFTRNLTTGEILDQVTGTFSKEIPGSLSGEEDAPITDSVSNIVFMGMGEPYLNYENVLNAIEKITSPEGLGMSPQRITVSSVGIPKMIRKMAEDDPKYHFALSLHAPTDAKRDQVIPFNLKHPLREVSDALKYYVEKTGKRFTIEYILFGNFNDSVEDARDLALFCRSFPVKVNIIEYNPVQNSGFTRSNPARTKAFVGFLEKRNMIVNVRLSKGKDIDAACGQLAGKQ